MNFLKKSLAPITDKAWEEIELQSESIMNEFLKGREIADVNGPKGIELGAISTGKLRVSSNQPREGIHFGSCEDHAASKKLKSLLNTWQALLPSF